MADEFVVPIKSILRTFELGIQLANKVSKSASATSAAQVLQVAKSLQGLQRSVTESYREFAASCREPFKQTLQNDDELRQLFKDLRSDLRERVNECEEFEDDPESFDFATFNTLEREAHNCAQQCIAIFHNVRDQVGTATSHPTARDISPRDDRASLTSMRQRAPSLNLPLPSNQNPLPTPAASPRENRLYLDVSPAEPVKPKSPWSIDSPSQFDLGAHTSSPARSIRRTSREVSPDNRNDSQARLISAQVVQSRVNANEEFLRRRRESRLMFEKEFRKSISSIDEHRVSQLYMSSPALSPAPATAGMPVSPIDGRTSRSSDYQMLMTRQRSQGGASHGTRSSIASSIQERPAVRRRDSEEDSIFGLRSGPLSPPLSEHRSSDNFEAIATTLKLPDFGEGVEPGIEVVDTVDYSTGLIPVDQIRDDATNGQATSISPPAASITSIDNSMRHDDSFFRFGGLCEGAKILLRGEPGFKMYKRPAGHYTATVSARCTKCPYEVGWNDVEKDRLLERAGIYQNSGIRFRQRFVSKSHLKAKSMDEPYYSCLFCIENHKKVEEHDATVFFSVAQLFKHLATHPQPLPNVVGLIVMYGPMPPEAVDFDIHFPTPDPIPHVFSIKNIHQKVATRPTATALTTHHPKITQSGFRDPSGDYSLSFAAGSKIVGVTFPNQFGGTWCMGYQDGNRGAFPTSTISLDLPPREDLLMNQSSTLVATARWDFKPKDTKDSRGWLKFSRGDQITNIGYTFQDQWCWSGCTNKGKSWGVFPQCFVENLREAELLSSSPSVRSRFGLKGRMPSSPTSRSPPTTLAFHGRQPSVRSTSSSGSGNMVANQSGLEVVQSPVHGSSSSGWRR